MLVAFNELVRTDTQREQTQQGKHKANIMKLWWSKRGVWPQWFANQISYDLENMGGSKNGGTQQPWVFL